MQTAIVITCVDERLNHELLRIQVRHKLAALYKTARRVLVLNEIGGNLGENFKNTVDLVLQGGDEITLVAVLHHDDCRAAKAGRRVPLDKTVAQVEAFLRQRGVSCSLAWGNIISANNHILWARDGVLEVAPAKATPQGYSPPTRSAPAPGERQDS